MKLRCFFGRILKKIRNDGGMTLSEVLMAVLIMSIIFTAVGGGVVVMQNNYRKVTLRAQAQTLLSTTVSAINAELESATGIVPEPSTTAVDVSCFYSSRRNAMLKFVNMGDGSSSDSDGSNTPPLSGVCVAYTDSKGESLKDALGKDLVIIEPLVSDKARTADLYAEIVTKSESDVIDISFHPAPAYGSTNEYFEYHIRVRSPRIQENGEDKIMEELVVKVSPISKLGKS